MSDQVQGLAWASLWQQDLNDVDDEVEAEGRDRDDLALDPEALLAWMQQPQKAWLQARGLRPGEH